MTPENETVFTAQSSPNGRQAESLASRVGRLAGLLSSPHFAASDRAALRRHAPGQPVPLAFYRIWLRHMDADLPSDHQSKAWTLLAWGLATAGSGAHRPDRPLGRALAECGYSEARLERLLSADAEIQRPLFASLVRFMASKGEGFDWRDAARLLLVVDDEKRESVHREIATAYYRQQALSERE